MRCHIYLGSDRLPYSAYDGDWSIGVEELKSDDARITHTL